MKLTTLVNARATARYLFIFLFALILVNAIGQKASFNVHNISLPEEIAYGENQFSSLYIHAGKLFLMSESRLQEKAEAKLYAIKLSDLHSKLADTNVALPYQKFHIYHLNKLQDKINFVNQYYEGLEALVIDGDNVYFSVETNTPSSNGYLLRGKLNDTAVVMDTSFLVTLRKPVRSDGSQIRNAGFEAITKRGKHVFAFYEFNYFPIANYVYRINTSAGAKNKKPGLLPIKQLPFRITDITESGKDHFTAINLFNNDYAGDTIYRTRTEDLGNTKRVKDSAGYHNYVSLVTIKFTGKNFTWETLWEFPPEYLRYNWEGIAAYDNGFFIMNDKYSPHTPYMSTLLYLQK